MLNYGQHPNTPLSILFYPGKAPAASAFVKRIREGIGRAKECLQKAQARQASYTNNTPQMCNSRLGSK